jgi:hypothetical protein
VAFHSNVASAAAKPVMFGVSLTPGVDDIIGEYRCGEASSLNKTFCTPWPWSDVAAITPHLPFTHPQLPAPQSIGPSQLMVHSLVSQGGANALFIQPEGWQHWAGTQS